MTLRVDGTLKPNNSYLFVPCLCNVLFSIQSRPEVTLQPFFVCSLFTLRFGLYSESSWGDPTTLICMFLVYVTCCSLFWVVLRWPNISYLFVPCLCNVLFSVQSRPGVTHCGWRDVQIHELTTLTTCRSACIFFLINSIFLMNLLTCWLFQWLSSWVYLFRSYFFCIIIYVPNISASAFLGGGGWLILISQW